MRIWVPATPFVRKKLFANGIIAFTLCDAIYVRSRRACTPIVLAHEYKHIEQYRQFGMDFYRAYHQETMLRGYTNNKFERAARRAEKKPIKMVKKRR